MGPLIPLFWTSGDISLGFKARVDPLLACFLVCAQRIPEITSGVTPADLLAASMVASHVPYMLHM